MREAWYTADGNVKGCNSYENSVIVPQKVKHRIAIRPQAVILVIPFLGRTKKNSKQVFKPFLYMDVHSSTIHNSRKAETPQMPVSNEGIDKL